MLQEQTDRTGHALPEPPRSNEARARRGPDVYLPAVEGVGHELRSRRGQDTVEHDPEPTRSGSLERLEGSRVHVLDDLAEELPEHPAGVESQGQDPGERTQTHHEDEDERPENLGNGPEPTEQRLCSDIDPDP